MEARQLLTQNQPSLELIPSEPSSKYLLGPTLDTLCFGGLSLIFLTALHFFVHPASSTYKLSWTMFYLSFLVNFPHFVSTYVLLYREGRNHLLKDLRFFWAGIMSPVLLAAGMIWVTKDAVIKNDPHSIGIFINLMYFLVGHHYVKQAFGIVMLLNGRASVYLSKAEASALKVSLYSVWGYSFLAGNIGTVAKNNLYSIPYQTLGLPPFLLTINLWVGGLATMTFLTLMARKYGLEAKLIPLSSWTVLAAICAWHLPANHPHYFLMIPFFHSLQYLPFSFLVNKKSSEEESLKFSDEKQKRFYKMGSLINFVLLIGCGGAVLWYIIPSWLDRDMTSSLSASLYVFSFNIFLNVHHYLVDNVIWRKQSPIMKKLS